MRYKYANLDLLTYHEKECIDTNSKCSREIKRRFKLYTTDLDDFDISGESLNMMKVIILPDPGKKIANYHYSIK